MTALPQGRPWRSPARCTSYYASVPGSGVRAPRPTHHLPIEFHKGRRPPTVVPTDSRPLSWPPIGALPRNRLASSATGSASPISPMPRLLHSLKRFHRAGGPHPAARCPLCPLQKNVSLRSQCAHWLWQSVIPLRPPMPPAAPFLSAAKEREERTPSKPRF